MLEREFKRDPYCNRFAAGYATAINILAVEYLIKLQDKDTYGYYCDIVNDLSEDELDDLDFELSFNMHTSTLGAMITQGDYDEQVRVLIGFLLAKRKKKMAMKKRFMNGED